MISQKGIDLIKYFEGLRLTPYQDSIGVYTVGYGHTGPDVKHLGTITQQAADHLLQQDLEKFSKGVAALVHVPLTQNEFDALVCFAFNVGLASLAGSTLLDHINSGAYTAAEESVQFLRWNHAGGKILPGLTKRREAEAALFRGDP